MQRRNFLRTSGLASGTFFVPRFLKAFEGEASYIKGHKKLVLIQLSGANDGLNTLVQHTNDIYFNNRNSIGLKKQDLLAVGDELGFHSSMYSFKELYDRGLVSVMNSVGYPNPSRSHFRSTDIWYTASSSEEFLKTGWVGRYLEKAGKKSIGAIEVDDSLSLIMKGRSMNGIATKNPRLFYKTTQDPYFDRVVEGYSASHLDEHNLGYLYKTVIDARSSAEFIFEKTRTYKSGQTYPQNVFGKQLKTIAEFINSGLETQVYYASLGGFDTHANQLNAQKRLLKIYSEGMKAFIEDLENNGTFGDTVIMTFSEFGRRLKQNAANGTDHGAANLLFLMGKNLKHPGMYNKPADLVDLDANGDIKYKIDFRDVYAVVAEGMVADRTVGDTERRPQDPRFGVVTNITLF